MHTFRNVVRIGLFVGLGWLIMYMNFIVPKYPTIDIDKHNVTV